MLIKKLNAEMDQTAKTLKINVVDFSMMLVAKREKKSRRVDQSRISKGIIV